MVKVIVAGCAGRMGRRIMTCAINNKNISLAGAFEWEKSPFVGTKVADLLGWAKTNCTIASSLSKIIDKGDVIIDFTSPQATFANVKEALKKKKKLVIGTTGLNAKEQSIIKEASKKIAIVFAPNMSIGVNLLFKLSKMAAEILDDGYDVEIVEAHHKHKKDSPSGTAHEIARQVAMGRGIDLKKKAVYGRQGMCGERKQGEIGIHAVRGGDVVGEHTLSFMTEGERIELTHKASSRDAFAKGSLVAAQFISKKKKGLYSMQDVLGLQ